MSCKLIFNDGSYVQDWLKILINYYGLSRTVLHVFVESYCKPNALSAPIVLPKPHITLIPLANWNSLSEF